MPDEIDDDLLEHPWLANYRSKNQVEKIEILTETIKNLEKNLGINAIITIINSILIVALIIGLLGAGLIEISSETADAAIGLVKDKIGSGE
jgi:hypothetical protein